MATLLDTLFGNADQTQALGGLFQGMMAGDTAGGFRVASGLLADAPRRRAQEQMAQMQLKTGQMTLDEQQRKLADEAQARQVLQDFYKNRGMPGAAPVGGPTGAVNAGLPPDMQIGALPATSGFQQSQQPGGVTAKADVWKQYNAIADNFAAKGLVQQAQQYYGLAEKMRPKYSTTPQQVRDPVTNRLINVLIGEDGTIQPMQYGVKPDMVLENLGGRTQAIDKNALNGGESFDRTQTPDSKAANALGWANFGETKRHHGATEAAAAGDQMGPLNPEAITNAAVRYNMTGVLPPMGMGKAAAVGRSAILNEAAKLSATNGTTPEDQAVAQVANKANSAALAKIQQQQTMVGAFERNFNKNADIALELSQKVDRTGAPIVNKWINAGRRAVTGDPDLAAFDASVKAVSNEYAKIISGSMGNTATAEGEIKKIEGLLNSAHTPEQVTSVLNLMKRETQNRMAGFEEEKKHLRESMIPAKTPSAATPAAAPKQLAPPVPLGAKASNLKTGQAYTLPNGKEAVWDGLQFKVK